MKIKYISKERAKKLEESVNFLSEYTKPADEFHVVGDNFEEIDAQGTSMLIELGHINQRRNEILNWFSK
jgi:hypothetical protein